MSGLAFLVVGLLTAAAGSMLGAGAKSVSRLELSRWVAERHRAAPLATALLSTPHHVIGTTTGLLLIGTVIAALGSASLLAPLPLLAAAGLVLVTVPLFLGIAHAAPRALGRRWAEPLMRTAGPVLGRGAAVWALFAPGSIGGALAGPGRKPAAGGSSDAEGFMAGVIAFTERAVREVMTPRTEIVAAADGAGVREVATLVEESGYTRLPVYRDSLDNIIGMVHAFDLLKVEDGATLPLRPVTVTPGTRRCADLLVDLQRERHQFAVVLDEFGGTAGVLTLEDLLEELVGEIFDEYDRRPATQNPEVELLELNGTAECAELAERFGVEFPIRTETVGGLLAGALGRIPRLGERVQIAGLEFDVLGATPTRVERIVVRRAPPEPA